MRVLLLSAVVVLFSISDLFAYNTPSFHFKATSYRDASKTSVTYAKRALQGFDLKVWLSNQMAMGLAAWDAGDGSQIPLEPHFGAEYPPGSGIEHLYGAGPLFGAIIVDSLSGDSLRVVSEAYNGNDGREFFLPEIKDTARDRMWITSPDSLLHPNRRAFDDDNDGKIDEDDLDGRDNDGDWNAAADDLGADGLPDSLETGCKGGYDAITNPDPAFDNYDVNGYDSCRQDYLGRYLRTNDRNRYTQNNGLSDHGERHVDEDYAALSEQDIYCSATDTFKTPVYSAHRPLGIKVIQKSYAWRNEGMGPILPFEYTFVNVGKKTLRNAFLGFFADIDVGPVSVPTFASHNYAASLLDRRTFYIHNPVDRGSTPLGITFLDASKIEGGPQRFIFQWHTFDEPGTLDSLIYSWMSCEEFGLRNCIKPDQPDSSLTDTRLFISVGPYPEVKPGDTLQLKLALVSGYDVARGPNNLKENASAAIYAYRNGYRNSMQDVPFSGPALNLSREEKSVRLHFSGAVLGGVDPMEVWDDSNKYVLTLGPGHWRTRGGEGHITGGRIFEGYRVYRADDLAGYPGSFSLLKEFDLIDSLGADAGFDSVYVDSTVEEGKSYWYAVTSFGIPHDIFITENPDTITGRVRIDTLAVGVRESFLGDNAEIISIPTGVDDDNTRPLTFRLYEAYPNPFNPATKIPFDLASQSVVSLRVFDVLGREVVNLAQGTYPAGSHTVEWNASGYPSGVYIVRLVAAGREAGGELSSAVTKVVLAK